MGTGSDLVSDMEQTPELAAIIVAGGQRERAARAVASVLAQNVVDRLEVLVMDLGPDTAPSLKGSDHPRVRVTRAGDKMLFAGARAAAVRMARAPVVAFMEEHCQAKPGWAEALITAHRGPWAGVACGFENGNPGSGTSDAAFRMTYGPYLPIHSSPGPAAWMPGHNSSYKRDVLLSYGTDLDELLKADIVMHTRMVQDGHRLFFEPSAVLLHGNETTLTSLGRGLFDWNWCYIGVQSRFSQWSFTRRVAQVPRALFLPWIRLARAFAYSARRGPAEIVQWTRDLPFFVAASHFSAAGQMAGALFDMSKAEKRFSYMETNEPRPSRGEWKLAQTS